MHKNFLKTKQYAAILKNNPWVLSFNKNVVNYLKYKFEQKKIHVDVSKRGVVFTTLFLTRRCNLNCNFCIVSKQRDEKDLLKYEMTVDQCSRIMNHYLLSKSLYVMLSGGEPLLNKDIANIIKLIKKQKRIVAMTTNGTLLPKKMDELIDSKIDSINVSVYDENIAQLKKTIPQVAKKAFVKLCKVVTKDMLKNPEKVEEVAALATESNCNGLYLANVLPGPGATQDLQNKTIQAGNPDYETFKNNLKKKFPKIDISFFTPLQKYPKERFCQMPWYFGVVDNQGDFGFCCYDSLCNKGNIFDDQNNAVYNSDPWTIVRKEILDTQSNMDVFCKECYLLNDRWSSTI